MKCTIETIKRTYKSSFYRISEYSEWEVEAKRLRGLGRAKFKMLRNGEAQYELKQPHLLLPYLVKLPLVIFFLESPFYFYRNGVKCGQWKTVRNPVLRPGMWEFYFEGMTYRLELGPYCSFRQMMRNESWTPQDILYRNGKKAAIFTRYCQESAHSVRAYYAVEYEVEMGERPDILLLFGAFLENYLNRDKFRNTYD